jgi:16S rRNA (uracil1498-N3)-methyltransferase
MIRLTWAGETEAGATEIFLDPAQARHGVTVLRLKSGDMVEVAGSAGLARARVTAAEMGRRGRPARLALALLEPWRNPEASPGPRLALALITPQRFDWAVEKAAELGAGALWPLVCDRVKPGLVRAAGARAGRWQKLADEARKQCGRPEPLPVNPPLALAELLIQPGPGFFMTPGGDDLTGSGLVPPPLGALVAVGPEGGFSPREEAAFLAAGFSPWSLGPLTLRTETAALAALSLFLPPAEAGRARPLPPSFLANESEKE